MKEKYQFERLIKKPWPFGNTLSRYDMFTLNQWDSGSIPYTSPDDVDRYRKNVDFLVSKNIGDWRWISETIEYHYNNYSFRHPVDFDEDFDWSDKTVFLGCSHVEGCGNKYEETIPSYYSSITGDNTVNMGFNSASNDTIFYNALWLADKNPKKIIVLWTYQERFMHLHNINVGENIYEDVTHFTSYALVGDDDSPMYNKFYTPERMLDTTHNRILKTINQNALSAIFGENIHFFDILDPDSFDPDAFTLLHAKDQLVKELTDAGVPTMEIVNKVYARDIYDMDPPDINLYGGHMGPLVNETVAKHIIDEINR